MTQLSMLGNVLMSDILKELILLECYVRRTEIIDDLKGVEK